MDYATKRVVFTVRYLLCLARRAREVILILVLACFGFHDVALAQYKPGNLLVHNISPVQSSLHGSNPNSASGGRINKLGVEPGSTRVFYAASEWGGLFKTDDRGRTWWHLDGHLPQATWDVKISPLDPQRVFATSWYDGKIEPLSGLSLSTDGGNTWSNPSSARPNESDCGSALQAAEPSAFGVAIDPDNPSNVFVGTNCGLAESNDNGATWRFVDPSPRTSGHPAIWSVVVHHQGIVDVCGIEGHFRRAVGTRDWTQGTGAIGGICSITVSPDEPDVLFMVVATTIFDSVDGGATWNTTYANPTPQGRIPFVVVNDRDGARYDLWFGDVALHRADCVTPAIGAAAGPRCELTPNWSVEQRGAHNDVGDIAFGIAVRDPELRNEACPLLFANDGGVYRNRIFQVPSCHTPLWDQPDKTTTALWLWDLEGVARNDSIRGEGVYIAQQDTGAFGTTDGANESQLPGWLSPTCCDSFDVEMEKERGVLTACCHSSGRVLRLFLAGKTFAGSTEVKTYPPGDLLGFQEMDTIANYAKSSYAIVTTSGVFISNDVFRRGGPIWTRLGREPPRGTCAIYASKRANGTPVFTIRTNECQSDSVGEIWQFEGVTALNRTWRKVQRNHVSQFGVFSVDKRNPDHIVATDYSSGSPEMVQTADGGQNWDTLTNLDTLMAGGGSFAVHSRIAPKRFSSFGEYFQPSLVAIDGDNPAFIAAGGVDSGVFLSLDSGVTWTLITDPMGLDPNVPHIPRPLYAHFEEMKPGLLNLYIGTRGRGVWRVTFSQEFNGPTAYESVECSVFDDGYSRVAGPSEAIFVSGRTAPGLNEVGKSCVPNNGPYGDCRKWLGKCRTVTSNQGVLFSVFDDGGANISNPSDAIYIDVAGRACVPDGTAAGNCRKWFGMGVTEDNRRVVCSLFNDGFVSTTIRTDAIYFPSPIPAAGEACQPDGTARGNCRRWFGRCVVLVPPP